MICIEVLRSNNKWQTEIADVTGTGLAIIVPSRLSVFPPEDKGSNKTCPQLTGLTGRWYKWCWNLGPFVSLVWTSSHPSVPTPHYKQHHGNQEEL